MTQKLIRQTSLLLAFMMLVSSLVVPITFASENVEETTGFGVGAYICPWNPGPVSIYAGTVPAECVPVAGMVMHIVTDTLGEESCVTDNSGVCYVQVPVDTWLTITENNSARPDLLPVVNPHVTHASAMDAIFVHVVEPVSVSEPEILPPAPEEIPDPLPEEHGELDPDGEGDGEVTDPDGEGDGDVTDPDGKSDGEVTDPDGEGDGEVTDPDGEGDGEVTDPDGEGDGEVTDPDGEGDGEVTDPDGAADGDATDPDGEGDGEVSDPDGAADGGVTDPGDEDVVATPQPSVGYVINVGDEGLTCYSAADFESDHLYVFAEGEQLQMLGTPVGEFVRVLCGDAPGYVAAENVSANDPADTEIVGNENKSNGSLSTKPSIGVEMVVGAGVEGLMCHTEPDASSSVIDGDRPLVNGNQFHVTGPVENGWLPIVCWGQDGFVEAAFTTAVPRTDPPIAVEMLVDGGEERLACRSAPHPQATVITTLPSGTQFFVTGAVSNGWLPIQCAGRVGYIPASLTTAVPRPPKQMTSVEMLVGTGSARLACRTAPHPQASVVMTLPAGTQFYATGSPTNGWLPVQCGGRDGFIPASLTTAMARAPKPARSVEMLVGTGDASLACRTAPHPQAMVIMTLPAGTQFFATGSISNGWLPIQCAGRDGYIPASLTTAFARSPKAATSVEMLVGVGGSSLACRTAPHPQATIIMNLPGTTQFYATGSPVNGWLPVQCKGRDGFIPASLTSVIARPARAMVSVEMLVGSGSSGVVCRTAPHPQATAIMILPSGTQFYATGSPVNGWLPVQCKGRDGFIPAAVTTALVRAPKAATSVEMLVGVGGGGLVCRTSPHPQGGVISTISNHSLVSVTGSAANGWLPVQCGARDGYIQIQYTTLTPQTLRPATSSTTIFNTGRAGTVCRTAPSVSSRSITTLYEGATVRITGSAVHNWLPVQCADRNGFIHLTSTTLRVPHQGPAGSARAAMVQGVGSGGLICRTQANGGATVATLADRTPVEVLSWANGWAQIRCGGATGYVAMRYLTFNASDPWTTGEAVWIDVNLSTQYMIVYQGERIIGQTYISSGRYPTFETPTGTFYINNKIRVSAMAGCSAGECWHVPDVPHQMYFTNRGHAFHGTYWHSNYGSRMSHGCINLPLGIAAWLYDITPIGTRVVIHY